MFLTVRQGSTRDSQSVKPGDNYPDIEGYRPNSVIRRNQNSDPKTAVITPCSVIYGAQQDGPGGLKNMVFRSARSAALTTPLPSKSALGSVEKNNGLKIARSAGLQVNL